MDAALLALNASQTAEQDILIVDDDPLIVQSLAKVLATSARLRFAIRGDQALELMKVSPPDLVLLDAHMPGLSGLDVLDAVRIDPVLCQVPVIMITSETGDLIEQMGLERGAVDFIAKPLHPGVVLARVRTHLRLASANAALRALSASDRLNLAAALAELRESHAELQATADRLGEANQSLLQFVRIASHDLREPLNTIDQFSGLLQEDLADQLPNQAQNYLRLVRRACSRMRTLLNDVVAYARLEVGSEEQLLPVELNGLFQELRDALAARIADTGATVNIGALPTVAGQASLLSLVFQNLLGNSLKFVPKDRRPEIDVFVQTRDGQHVISVRDNGIGIPPEHHAAIFQPFVRMNRRQDYEGSGLGLAISHRIVQAHGGTLRVVSEPSQRPGAEFQVVLPAR